MTDVPSRRRLLKWLLAAGTAAAAGAAVFLPRKANAYYTGPVSDHFDGERFFNPGGRGTKSFGQLAKLYTQETWSTWPDSVPGLPPDRPPREVTGARARIVHIGHASWLLQTGGQNILIDPVWSQRAGPYNIIGPMRANPPGVAFDDLPPIHVVLVTHNHYDHFDIATLARLQQRDKPRFVMPLGNDAILRAEIGELAATAVDWGQVTELSPQVGVFAEPTQHWSARGTRDRMHALWASFVITTPAGKIYAIGDTGFGDGRTFRQVALRHPKVRLALIPIGAYEPRWFMGDQHINPVEAVSALELSGAQAALGHHWGTFRLTAEPHDQPPADLAKALADRGHAPERFQPARPGLVTEI